MCNRLALGVVVWCASSLVTTGQAQANRTVALGNQHFAVSLVIDEAASQDTFGPRFDRTARVKQITLAGQTFLGIYGLADEFGIIGTGVLGYDQAQVGGSFLKIGVGVLQRDTDKPYKFDRPYPVNALPPITSHVSGDSLEVQQEATLGDAGYRYLKRYDVDVKAATLTIAYALTNTGSQAITFDQYNHNWFMMDSQPIGPSYTITTDFAIAPGSRDWLDRQNHRLAIKQIVEKPCYFPSPQPFAKAANRFELSQATSGLQVTVTGDFPASRFAFFGNSDGICPEVFYEVTVEPGETCRWTRTYQFAETSK